MKLDLSKVSDAKKKYDFVLFVDIAGGNPNGDPDYDNRPRLDDELGHGLITDVCIKRKVRDYIDIRYGNTPRNAIYVMNRGVFLEQVNDSIVQECKEDKEFLGKYDSPLEKGGKPLPHVISNYFCNKYFDVRCFGAVPGKPMEQSTIRGPIQVQFGRSIDPIVVQEHAISRVVQNKSSSRAQGDDVHGTFGSKYTVRYGLYRFNGHYSPFLAQRTGFNDSDIALFWEALVKWPCTDSSAARSSMGVQGLYVFQHDDPFGNAPAHTLIDLVKLSPQGDSNAMSWADYSDRLSVPEDGEEVVPGVTFHRLVG